MFSYLMMRYSAMRLALELSFGAEFAQTPVVKQTTRARLSFDESESRSVKEDKQENKTEKGEGGFLRRASAFYERSLTRHVTVLA